MATILTPAPANPPDLSNHLCISLVGAFAALVIGFALLLAGAVLPAVQFHPVIVPAEAAIRTAAAPGDEGHNVAGMPRAPSRFFPTVDRLGADLRSPAPTSSPRIGADEERAVGRGTRAESGHLAATLLPRYSHDVRWDLMEMAASQHHDWTVRCPCPVYPIDVSRTGPR